MTPEQRMRKVLLELQVISTAPAQNIEGRTSRGKPGTIPPPRCEAPHLSFVEKWNAASTDGERLSVVEEAETELVRWRYTPNPHLDSTTKRDRLIIGLDDRKLKVVTEVYGHSVSHISRLRKWAREFQAEYPDVVRALLAEDGR